MVHVSVIPLINVRHAPLYSVSKITFKEPHETLYQILYELYILTPDATRLVTLLKERMLGARLETVSYHLAKTIN